LKVEIVSLDVLASSGDGRVGTTLIRPLLDINNSNFLLVYNYLVVLLFLFVPIEKLSNGFLKRGTGTNA
jgi:hypothetical protein